MSFVTRLERPQRIRFSPCEPAGTVLSPLCLMMISGLLTGGFNDGLRIAFAVLIGPRRVGTPTVWLTCDFTVVGSIGDDVVLGLCRLSTWGDPRWCWRWVEKPLTH
jgi:4-hydroxybenzoyl-CoA thioesterase